MLIAALKMVLNCGMTEPDGSQEVAEAALIPVLTKAVQELSTALDAALARIATLEG